MKKSGLADSPFFKVTTQKPPVFHAPRISVSRKTSKPSHMGKAKRRKRPATMLPTNHDTISPIYLDGVLSIIRQAVKVFGKEAANHRFTPEEKKAITDIIYTYKNQKIKTSENEVVRIAVNFLVEDFKQNGEQSVLDLILRALKG